MSTTFVVFGERGDYSDYSGWVVAVHQTRESAEKHARLANEWMGKQPFRRDYSLPATISPYDPATDSHAWDRSTYRVLEVPEGWELPP